MSSVKCPECSMTNWSVAMTCKRCGNFLQPVDEKCAPSYADAPLPPPSTPVAAEFSAAAQSSAEDDQDLNKQMPDQTDYPPQHAAADMSPNHQSQSPRQSAYGH